MNKKYTANDIGCYANGLLFGRTHVRHILFNLVNEAYSCTQRGQSRKKYLKILADSLLQDPRSPFPNETENTTIAVINEELCDKEVTFILSHINSILCLVNKSSAYAQLSDIINQELQDK